MLLRRAHELCLALVAQGVPALARGLQGLPRLGPRGHLRAHARPASPKVT